MKIFAIALLALALPAGAIDLAKLNGGAVIVSQVVAKGDDYLVQAIRFPFLNPLREIRLPRQPQVGQVLLHTKLPGGQGRELLRTQTSREWRTRVGSFRHSRIVGVAHDKERLYVAVWSAGGRGVIPAFLVPLEKRPKTSHHYVKQLRLYVFALAEGKLIKTAAVPGAPDKVFPITTAAPGPLRVVNGGVDCHGTKLRFDGKKGAGGDAKR